MRTSSFLFAAALVLVAATNAEMAEDEATFNEATSFVQTFIAENQGGETACMKVATDSINTIKNQCVGVQASVVTASKANQVCCEEGNGAVCSAKMAHYTNQQIAGSCHRELGEMKRTSISFGSTSFKSLTEGKCGNFFSGSAYQKTHKKVTKKIKECQKADGAVSSSKTALENAVKNASKNREKCNKKYQTALDKAYNTAHKTCDSDSNKKAFKRAMHMKCVLAGTALKDCKVSGAPKVNKVTQSKLTCSAQTGEFFDEPSSSTSISKSVYAGKCEFKFDYPHRYVGKTQTRNYSPWVSCMAKTGNGNEKIKGFRLNNSNKNIGYLFYEPFGKNKQYNTWDPNKYYLCPRGWHWATQKEFNGACKGGSGHVGYSQCGASGYRHINSYGSYWMDVYKWRFSDSRKGHDGYGKYAHSGHGECTTPSQDTNASRFAGIICMKD